MTHNAGVTTAGHLGSFRASSHAATAASARTRQRWRTSRRRRCRCRRASTSNGSAPRGYRLTHDGHTLLIDPYLTRIPLRDVLRRAPALPDPALHQELLRRDLGEVAGILVGHTHFDHAIDVPALARSLGTSAYGSDSLARLMRLHGLGQRAVEVEPHRAYELGPFTVRFVPSLHSKLLLGHRVPFDGALSCEHLDALSPAAYKCGAIYGLHVEVAGTTFYHQGSANLIDDLVPSGGRRRLPRGDRRTQLHRGTTGTGSCGACSPTSSSPTTSTTSSGRSRPRWASRRTSTSPRSPTRSTPSAATSRWPRSSR